MANLDEIRDGNGKLPSFAWPGGYPILYVASDGETFCSDCANGENGSQARISDGPEDAPRDGWRIDGFAIHYEGPDELCCHCGVLIESTYGDPDAKEGD